MARRALGQQCQLVLHAGSLEFSSGGFELSMGLGSSASLCLQPSFLLFAESLEFGAGFGSSTSLCLQPSVLLLAGSFELGAGLGIASLCLQ